jgi:type IV pilus assembly protein PilP
MSDSTIHRVKPGNYIGQNYGKITSISESEVSVTEIVPDGIGGWTERQASLALSE